MDNERLHTLFIELQNGQMDSFDEFYELTKRGVFSVSYQILKSQDEAENVLQETYLQFLKKNKRRNYSFDMETVSETENDTGQDDTVMKVMREVLNPKEMEIVLMHSLYDMTHKEIAKQLGKPLGTITWAYNNAIKKLKEALIRYGYQE